MSIPARKVVAILISVAAILFGGESLLGSFAGAGALIYLSTLAYRTDQHFWITFFGVLAVIYSPVGGIIPLTFAFYIFPVPFVVALVLIVSIWKFDVPERFVSWY